MTGADGRARVAPGINIWSGTPGLGGALTNPTALARAKGSIQQDYPLVFRGLRFPDAELAYGAFSAGLDRDAKVALCEEVVRAKLEQYPRLLRAITTQGGEAWLRRCRHQTGAASLSGRWWEGAGDRSPFLRALLGAYRQVLHQTPPARSGPSL